MSTKYNINELFSSNLGTVGTIVTGLALGFLFRSKKTTVVTKNVISMEEFYKIKNGDYIICNSSITDDGSFNGDEYIICKVVDAVFRRLSSVQNYVVVVNVADGMPYAAPIDAIIGFVKGGEIYDEN